MTDRPCSNMIDYEGERWGINPCGASASRDCTKCHHPVCPTHLDLDPEGHPNTKPVCMDCYEAENRAVGQRASQRSAKAGKAASARRLQERRATPGERQGEPRRRGPGVRLEASEATESPI